MDTYDFWNKLKKEYLFTMSKIGSDLLKKDDSNQYITTRMFLTSENESHMSMQLPQWVPLTSDF